MKLRFSMAFQELQRASVLKRSFRRSPLGSAVGEYKEYEAEQTAFFREVYLDFRG